MLLAVLDAGLEACDDFIGEFTGVVCVDVEGLYLLGEYIVLLVDGELSRVFL